MISKKKFKKVKKFEKHLKAKAKKLGFRIEEFTAMEVGENFSVRARLLVEKKG